MLRQVGCTVAACAWALVAIAQPSAALGSGGRYYPETGHTLAAEFVELFDEHGGLEILGYPITDAFVDAGAGMVVQYTQNGRLELVPDLYGAGYAVRRSSLSVSMGLGQPPAPASQDRGCRYFAETGHNLCHAFLTFFDENGGLDVFGYPVSEFALEGDRIVQYFQGLRLDWRPDVRGAGRVQVGALGQVHFGSQGYDAALLRPHQPSDPLQYRVVELRVQAWVWQPVTGSHGSQQISVLVRDQTASPIAGASVVLVAHFPDQEQTLILPPTDEHGLSQLTLAYAGVPPGSSIELEIIASYGDLRTSTRDSFRVWW